MKQYTPKQKIKILQAIYNMLRNERDYDFAATTLSSRFICHCFEFHTGLPYIDTFIYLPELFENRNKCDFYDMSYTDAWHSTKTQKRAAIRKTIKQLQIQIQ